MVDSRFWLGSPILYTSDMICIYIYIYISGMWQGRVDELMPTKTFGKNSLGCFRIQLRKLVQAVNLINIYNICTIL